MKKPDYQNPTLEEIAIMSKRKPTVAVGMLRQYKRQKSRSLDKEGKPSEPIPDSSANVASKEQKGVQPAPPTEEDTTTAADVQTPPIDSPTKKEQTMPVMKSESDPKKSVPSMRQIHIMKSHSEQTAARMYQRRKAALKDQTDSTPPTPPTPSS